MTRVDFISYSAPPDNDERTTSRLRAEDGYELTLTPLGIEARRDGACCTYPFGAVRQWWTA